MSRSTRTRQADRRIRHWPAIVLAGLLGFAGVWVFLGVSERMGLTVGDAPETRRVGTAQIQSCSRDAVYLWLTLTCDAKVQWQGEPKPDDGTVRVHAVHELQGTADVREQRYQASRTSSTWRVLSTEVPVRSDGALFFVMMMGFPVLGAGLGLFAGFRLARLLPEPPARTPKKLTLKSRMSSKRDRDSRFNKRGRR